jgi:tetratricopeptide (TPR) repeat protein
MATLSSRKRKHTATGLGTASCQTPTSGRRTRARRGSATAAASSSETVGSSQAQASSSPSATASCSRQAPTRSSPVSPPSAAAAGGGEHEASAISPAAAASTSQESATTATPNTSVIDDIAAMNEVGIANLYAGDAMVAKESFIRALSRCANTDMMSKTLLKGSSSSSSNSSSATAAAEVASVAAAANQKSGNPSAASLDASSQMTSMMCSFQDDDKNHGSAISGTEGSTLASSEVSTGAAASSTATSVAAAVAVTATTSSASMYIYQREEYDEGMYVYKEALYLDKQTTTTSSALRDATLMYNVGQAHLRTRQYLEAKRWFMRALARFQQTTTTTMSSTGEPQTNTSASITKTLSPESLLTTLSTSILKKQTKTNTTKSAAVSCATMLMSPLLNVVKIHHNIAFCCYCLGENEHAMTHYQFAFQSLHTLGGEATSKQQQTISSNHNTSIIHNGMSSISSSICDLDLAACCNSIGILHLCRGSITDSAKAMEFLQLSLTIYKRVLGQASTQVATCLSNIARVFFSRQDYETALTLFLEALKIREELLQQQNQQLIGSGAAPARAGVDQAACYFNLAQTYSKIGKPEPALRHFQTFRDLAEPHLGKGHRDIATCIKAMACIHYEQGNLTEACNLLEQAVQCSRTSAKEYPLELASLLRDMGCLYSMTNHLHKALEAHTESLQIQQVAYKNDSRNPNIMVTLLHIAQTKKKQGDYTAALDVYRTVYSIQLDVFGPQSLEVAATLCSIGLMLYLKHDLKSSLNYYQEALQVRKEYFKSDLNFDIAATYNSIGLIAFKMNKLELAKTSFQECIRIRVQLEGTDCHRDIVTLYSNLGTVYLANGEDKESIQMFSESIRLERKTLGDKHLGVAVSLQHLAQLHQDRGELELAHQYFVEALEITRQVDEGIMANKQRTICTLLNLMGNIHLMRAEVKEMMECFTEASRVKGHDCSSLVIAGYTFYGISKLHPPCAPVA